MAFRAWAQSILGPSPPGHRVQEFLKSESEHQVTVPQVFNDLVEQNTLGNRPLAKAPEPPGDGKDSSLRFS
jgi:hypothetical protein